MARSNQQWCERHWDAVRSTLDGERPVNGMLATAELMERWLALKERRLGEDMPLASEADALNRLLARDSPLCCYLGERVLKQVMAACILPEEYRHLSPKEGHALHMQRVRGFRLS